MSNSLPTTSIEFDEQTKDLFLEKVKELGELIERDQIDVVVFLDRSARPFSWALREYWKFHPPLIRPVIRYFNPDIGGKLHMDKRNGVEIVPGFLGLVGVANPFVTTREKVDLADVVLSKTRPDGSPDTFTTADVPEALKNIKFNDHAILEMRANFDFKLSSKEWSRPKVLIVEEESWTGANLIASMISFEKAFPHLDIFGKSLLPLRGTVGCEWPWAVGTRKGITGLIESPLYSHIFSAPADARLIKRYEEEIKKIEEDVKYLFEKAMEIIEDHYRNVSIHPLSAGRNLSLLRSAIDSIKIEWLEDPTFNFNDWYLQTIFLPIASFLDVQSPSFKFPPLEEIQRKVARLQFLETKKRNISFGLAEIQENVQQMTLFRAYVTKVVSRSFEDTP